MPGTTAILDDFTRANATTLGANWALLTNFNFGGSDLGVTGNQAYNPTSGTYIVMYWSAATFGPDCEVYLTLSTVSSDNIALYARTQQPGYNTFDGYMLNVDRTAGEFSIRRVDNGTETVLGAAVSQAVASGNKILLEVIGSTITAYINTAGTWVSVLSRTDATYSAAGGLAFYGGGNATTWRYDDFGGGTLSSFNPTQTVTETGAGADADSGVRAATIAESATGVDASSGLRAGTVAESGSGADLTSGTIGSTAADSASASDSASATGSGAASDAGAGVDAPSGLLAATVADSATGVDQTSASGSGTGSASDSGSGVDAAAASVASTAADSMSAADLPSGLIRVTLADVATGVDRATVPGSGTAIINALAQLAQRATPMARLAQHTKSSARITPAARVAALTRRAAPVATLAQQPRPRAAIVRA